VNARHDPGDDESLRRAAAALSARRYGEAEAGCRRVAEGVPHWSAAQNLLASLNFYRGRLQDAEAACRSAIGATPEFADAWVNLGIILAEAGRPDDALAALECALSLRPDLAAARRTRARLRADRGDHREALADIRAVRPQSPLDVLMAMRSLLGADAASQALALYRRLETARPRAGRDDRFDPAHVADLRRFDDLPLAGDGALLAFEDCALFSGEWQLLDSDGSLYLDLFRHVPAGGAASTYVAACGGGKAIVRRPKPVTTVEEPAFFLGGSDNLYHWLVDFLPGLRRLEAQHDLRHCRIVINAPVARFQEQALSRLGVDPERLIRCRYPALYRFRRLVVPHAGSRRFGIDGAPDRWQPTPNAEDLAWLRKCFADAMAPRSRGRRLFLSRADARQRRLVDEDGVFARLAPLGFERIAAGSLSFEQQVRLFSEADIVVGPHGAALTNIVFAPPTATVVELRARYRSPLFFEELARVRGLEYRTVVGDTVHPADGSLEREFWDYTIAPEAAAEAAAAVPERRAPVS